MLLCNYKPNELATILYFILLISNETYILIKTLFLKYNKEFQMSGFLNKLLVYLKL